MLFRSFFTLSVKDFISITGPYEKSRRAAVVNKKQMRIPQTVGIKKRKKGPFQASCFLFDGEAGSGTGPMHQGEQNRAHSGYPGPAVCSKKLQQLRAFYFYQTSSRHIGHDDDGNDNFIGRKSQKKAGQDASIHPQALAKGSRKPVREVRSVAWLSRCTLARIQMIRPAGAADTMRARGPL